MGPEALMWARYTQVKHWLQRYRVAVWMGSGILMATVTLHLAGVWNGILIVLTMVSLNLLCQIAVPE